MKKDIFGNIQRQNPLMGEPKTSEGIQDQQIIALIDKVEAIEKRLEAAEREIKKIKLDSEASR
jgi:hypothetical protein